MKPQIYNKRIYWMILVFLYQVLLLSSCHSTTPQSTTTTTELVKTAIPTTLSQTPTLESTEVDTAVTPSLTPIMTNTPIIPPPSATNAPMPCPPFVLEYDIPDPDTPENYIGRHYDYHNLPPELENLGGSLLRERNTKLELFINRFKWHENRELFWLEKLVCRDKNGYPYFEIVDAFETSILSGGESSPGVCFDGENKVKIVGGLGVYDKSTLVTIGEYRGWPFTKILFIYDIDFVAEKFIMLDPEGLICLEDPGP